MLKFIYFFSFVTFVCLANRNMVLRRVFWPKRDDVTGEWRKLHNEELRDLYSLPNTVRVVNSRRMRWAGHVARMGEGAQASGGET